MYEHLYDDLVNEIRAVAANVDGVVATEKCFIRKAGMHFYVDLHAIVDGSISVRDGHDLAHKLKDALQLQIPSLHQVLIHVEPTPNR